jgi:LacI family transcriptional regulator, galactose operon repressor
LSEADDGGIAPARAVRMKDIAEHLGLSQTTVSHVLTGKHRKFRISPATVERVWRLAEKLGYRANVMARAFRERRSYAVCLAVEDLQNPFWAGIAIGAEREAEEHGYALVVTDLGGSAERQRRALQLVRDQRVDGLIVSPVRGGDSDLATAHRHGLPLVQVDRAVARLPVACVRTDHEAGSVLALRHLLERGRRDVVYVGGPLDIPNYRQRLAGVRKELRRHGLKPADELVLDDSSPAEAEREVARVLRRMRRPFALFAANYALTVGTLRAIRAAGRAVPEDVELVGFDDIQMADLLLYPVTTVAQDVSSIGREAIRLLLDVIRNGKRSAQHVLLPPRLIPR